MARDVYHMTVSQPTLEPDLGVDVLKPLVGVRCSVFARGTTTLVTIYQRPTGVAEGPTPESTATGGPNPFVTGPTGDIEFWCDGPRELDVLIEDTQAPARIPARTMGWNVMTAAAGSIPSSFLADDGNLALTNLGPDVLRQMVQIGQVIDWWRPPEAATMPPPEGFEICDGHQVLQGSHDFPVAGPINVPDLRNMFVLGATTAKADGTGAAQGNAATDAPGIRGTGGSNLAKDFRHGHGVPGVSHQHLTTTPDHLHGVGSLYTGGHSHSVSGGTGAEYQGALTRASGTGTCSYPGHTHPVSGTAAAVGNIGVGGTTGASDRILSAWSGGPNVSLDTATNSLTWTTDPGSGGAVVDLRPKFIGLLKLMKVRRS